MKCMNKIIIPRRKPNHIQICSMDVWREGLCVCVCMCLRCQMMLNTHNDYASRPLCIHTQKHLWNHLLIPFI